MRKIYTLFIFLLIITSCSKDAFKRYDKRIQGTWQLYDVDRRGIGGSTSNVSFTEGEFTFEDGGRMTYTDESGNLYNGSWDIRKEWRRGACNTDDEGRTRCDDRYVSALFISAVNFTTQDLKTEHFDEMDFRSTNRFVAYVNSGWHTYVFRFRR